MHRATAIVPQVGGGEQLVPESQTLAGEVAQRALGLTDRPEHAEVADRGPLSPWGAVEHEHAPAAPGGRMRQGEADDAGPDDDVIDSFGRHRSSDRLTA